MRILHSVSSVNPAGGGPIEGIKRLGEILPSRGSISEIVSLDPPNARWVQECPLKVHAMGPAIGKYGYTRRLIPWLLSHAAKFDIVVIDGIWQYSSFGTARALKRLGRPYVVFTHGMLDPWFKSEYPLKHLKKWAYWPWGEYRVLRDARAVLFTCEEEKLLARQSFWLYRAHEEVVAFGTADPLSAGADKREAFFRKAPHLRNKRFLLFLGRIHPKKGCDTLIQAFARVAEVAGELELVFVGPDSTQWRSNLERLALTQGVSDRLTWLSALDGDAKWGAFHAAEAFVLPSHQENFGIAVAEALGCGLPVLITNKVNIWREIRSSGAGLVDADSIEGVTNLLLSWIGMDLNERVRMGRNARACFLAHFEIGGAVDSLLAVITRALSANTTAPISQSA